MLFYIIYKSWPNLKIKYIKKIKKLISNQLKKWKKNRKIFYTCRFLKLFRYVLVSQLNLKENENNSIVF